MDFIIRVRFLRLLRRKATGLLVSMLGLRKREQYWPRKLSSPQASWARTSRHWSKDPKSVMVPSKMPAGGRPMASTILSAHGSSLRTASTHLSRAAVH
uniref:Putative secreted protein n=1 Tax=Ixodes ricinus TaxID=34613 RepID=A0A6B0UAW1_IXORI